MSKNREVGTAAFGGLIVGGALTAVLGITDLPLVSALGALIGGGIAAYLLYGKIGQGAMAGVLSAIFGYPFSIGIVYILLIFGVYTPPSGPTPAMSVIQTGVIVEFLLNLVAGAVGGVIVSSVRRPSSALEASAEMPVSPGLGQSRYCVQCGAQLQAGTLICPHCGARQPQ
jgi:hypothetical protein